MRPTASARRRVVTATAALTAMSAALVLPATAAAAHPSSSTDGATSSCATIGQGASGRAVRAVQRLVGADVDGQYGPATAKALRTWQQANGVAVTGVVDAATWSAMPAAVAAKACSRKAHGSGVIVGCAKLQQGSDGLAVIVLQDALGIGADGQFGSATAAAVKSTQTKAGLTPTGVTNRKTWKALHLLGTPACTRRTSAPPLPKDWKAQQKVRANVVKLATALEAKPGTTTNQIALRAMAFEKKQIGKPYAWGGIGPKSYDCSGLQMTSYLHAGITIPRVAAAQYAGSGPTVPLDQAQQGDLLFYASDVTKPATIYHVVMYVGNGDILDAPHTGADVAIQPLWTTDLLPVAVRPVAGLTLPVSTGASGWTVSQLQQALNRHGAALAVDGGFGPTTKAAVTAWQTKHDIKPTGVVRLSTWLTFH